MPTIMPQNSFLTRGHKILLDTAWLSMGYATFNRLPEGISFTGGLHPAEVEFFYDITWIDDKGERQVEQQVFDEFFRIVRKARKFILIDMFLFNDFQGVLPEHHRQLCNELTDLLVEKKATHPDIQICFITDPINTVYGGLNNDYLVRLADCGTNVVVTDLDQLRDSNPVYSFFWRLLVRPFGNTTQRTWLRSPFSDEKVTLRSYLRLFNLKANHRKTLIADDAGNHWVGMICTGNPHNGSSAHRNVAVRFTGPAVADLFKTENAVIQMGRVPGYLEKPADVPPTVSDTQLQVITEKQIKHAVLNAIDSTQEGDEIALILFYLSDRQVIESLIRAQARAVNVRVILDPNKDAFGLPKSGIPNRPVGRVLDRSGISVRWADTHGEQCHSKLLLVHRKDSESTLIVGSANFTRRNLDDFNLETDALILANRNTALIHSVQALFDRLWNNEPGRTYSADYDKYRDPGRWRYFLYWLMEKTGLSTF